MLNWKIGGHSVTNHRSLIYIYIYIHMHIHMHIHVHIHIRINIHILTHVQQRRKHVAALCLGLGGGHFNLSKGTTLGLRYVYLGDIHCGPGAFDDDVSR